MENTTEIMKNEEVIETTTEELAEATTGKGLKIVAGIGIGVLAGFAIYKYIAKPIYAKIKNKKEAKAELHVGECEESDYQDEDYSKETD